MPIAQSVVVSICRGQANIRPFVPGLISFSSRRLRLRLLAGVIPAGFSFLPTTVPVATFSCGGQLPGLALIGECAGRSYDEVRKRPTPIVDRKIIFHRPE